MSAASAAVVQAQPAAFGCHASGAGPLSLPDRRCTPGALNPAVTPQSLGSTICRSGYTASVRPPESVTEQEKAASMRAYGDPDDPSAYEYDHLVPLELGGAANDPRNLWPEPAGSPNPKDALEDRLKALVCDGSLALATAQQAIATSWTAAYARYVGTPAVAPAPAPGPRGSTAPAAPAPTQAAPGQPAVVHAGSFCAPVGATGVTDHGTAMVCGTTARSPTRTRWHAA